MFFASSSTLVKFNRPMRSFLSLILVMLTALAASAREALVHLNNPSPEPVFGETLAVRFTTPMYAAGDEANRPPNPVTLSPSIPHTFEWTSPVSGSLRFTAPPQIGTTYSISPRLGLTDASGTIVTLHKTQPTSIQTPAPALVGHRVEPIIYNYWEGADKELLHHGTNQNPVVCLTFNTPVPPLETFLAETYFVSDQNERIPAVEARRGTRLESDAAMAQPWNSPWLREAREQQLREMLSKYEAAKKRSGDTAAAVAAATAAAKAFGNSEANAAITRPWSRPWLQEAREWRLRQSLFRYEGSKGNEAAEAREFKEMSEQTYLTDPPCGFLVSPASPLTPDRLWSIVLPPTLIPNAKNVNLGFVSKFRFLGARVVHRPLAQPELGIHFSHNPRLPKSDPKKQQELDVALQENRISEAEYAAALALKNITLSVNDGLPFIIAGDEDLASLRVPIRANSGDRCKISIPALTLDDGQTLPPTVIERHVPRLVPRLILKGELVRLAPKDQKDIKLLCVRIPRVKLTLHHIPPSSAAKAFEVWTKTYAILQERETLGDPPPADAAESPTQTLARIKGDTPKLRVDPEQLGGLKIHEEIIEPSYGNEDAVIHCTPWSKLLGANSVGMYLVTAEEFDPEKVIQRPLRSGVQQLVQRSDLSIQLLNSGRQSALCIANSSISGNPLSGITCTLFDAAWKLQETVVTGADGTASIDAANVAFVQASRNNEVIIFQTTSGRLIGEPAKEESRVPVQTLLFTDRHIYRPSETAHAKFIARESVQGSLRPPEANQQSWYLKGPQGQMVDSGNLDISNRGSAHFDIRLPSVPGPYLLTIGEEGSRFASNTSLTVAEFEPDAFEIELTAPTQVTCPSPALIRAEARYLSGLPLSATTLHWTLNTVSSSFSAPTAPDHSFRPNWHDWRLRDSDEAYSELREGTVPLEKDGKAEFSIPLAMPQKLGRRDASLSVEITDAENQTLSQDRRFTVNTSDFYLGINRPSAWLRQPGKSIPISVIAVDLEGKCIAPPNPVEIRLQQIHWKSNILKTPSGERITHTYDLGPVHTVPVTVTAHPLKRGLLTIPKSHQSVDLSFLEPGEYIAEIATTDKSARKVSTRCSFAIHKVASHANLANSSQPIEDEDESPYFSGDFPLKLIADKPRYSPGETANLTLRSPVHGTATLCIGALPVVHTQTYRVNPGLNGIELPITEALIPGNRITVTLVESLPPGTTEKHYARSASVSLNLVVHPRDERLTVSIENLPPDTRPKSVLSPIVRVSDAGGEPLADAEVTLFAVDEGVLLLSGYETPNPNAALYPNKFRSLQKVSSRDIIEGHNYTDIYLPFANKGYLVGGGGDDTSGMRNYFEFTPLWIANARTNAKGEFTATLKVPDNITAYRLMAVVHHAGHRFGNSEKRLRVNKPLQINPGIPQFVSQGDTVEIRCSVQNTTAREIAVELTFDPTGGATVATPKKVAATLPSNSTTPFNFTTSFPESGNIQLKWNVRSSDGKESDGLHVPLTVRSPYPTRHQTIVARVTDKPLDLLSEINAEFLEGEGQVDISLSRNPAIQLEGIIDSLLSYPYGCAEQTMSRLFPWILANSFPVKHLRKETRRNVIQSGIHRLATMVKPQGGISYWPLNAPSLTPPDSFERWVTAYIGIGIAIMRKDSDPIVAEAASAELETPVFDYLKTYLEKTAPSPEENDVLSMSAYALALFGKPNHAANERLLANLKSLNTFQRSLLAMTLHTCKTATPASLTTLLEPIADEKLTSPFESQYLNRAVRLLALATCQLHPDQQETLFTEIIRGSGLSHHFTTQDNVWRLLAAQSHLATLPVGADSTEISWKIATTKSDETLTKTNPTSTRTLRWHGIKDRFKPTSIHRKNEAPLFASIKTSSTPLETQVAQNLGFNLQRTIVPQSNEPLKVGDLVEIKITVDVHAPTSFVALECPLPSLLEPLQGFETRGKKDRVPSAKWSSHSEIRSDRILFFWNDMPPGRYSASAYARVRASGNAVIPATRIEEMYRPQRFAETATERFVIP